eukprot:CAMPEP_0113499018 /NCGR_PEP_ID=MMETSP0014_2-20120614/31511_1 /TAXON_ID=2857 /ORGANISM="Nitzschia sp." /LENGTH=757 /DNA_ID=CAMNT_0000393139 /DNA_START=113 /DNA_END=2383 /DNA_ORIENTATION=- /assembly_acc=CAM_ASM_000159
MNNGTASSRVSAPSVGASSVAAGDAPAASETTPLLMLGRQREQQKHQQQHETEDEDEGEEGQILRNGQNNDDNDDDDDDSQQQERYLPDQYNSTSTEATRKQSNSSKQQNHRQKNMPSKYHYTLTYDQRRTIKILDDTISQTKMSASTKKNKSSDENGRHGYDDDEFLHVELPWLTVSQVQDEYRYHRRRDNDRRHDNNSRAMLVDTSIDTIEDDDDGQVDEDVEANTSVLYGIENGDGDFDVDNGSELQQLLPTPPKSSDGANSQDNDDADDDGGGGGVRQNHLSPNSSCGCIVTSLLGASLITFFVTIVVSVLMIHYGLPIWTDNERQALSWIPSVLRTPSGFMMFVYPSITAVLAWIGTIGPIQSRLWSYSFEVTHYCSSATTKQLILDVIEEQIYIRVTSIVDLVDMNVGLSIDNLSSKLTLSEREKVKFKAYDPTFPTLPDDQHHFVEDEIQSSKSELQSSVLRFIQQAQGDGNDKDDDGTVVTDEMILSWMDQPQYTYLKSQQEYYWSIVGMNLSLYFFTHLVLSYITCWSIAGFVLPFLLSNGTLQRITDEIDNNVLEPLGLTDIVATPMLLWIITLSFEAYLYSCFYVGIVVYSYQTAAKKTVRVVNMLRSSTLSPKVTELLKDHGVISLCRDILGTRMERCRKKFVFLIHESHRVEKMREVIAAAEAQKEKAGDGSMNDSFSVTSSIATMMNAIDCGGDGLDFSKSSLLGGDHPTTSDTTTTTTTTTTGPQKQTKKVNGSGSKWFSTW